MQTKANKNQTLWVLLIALVLIILCIGGLWAYVKSADAETGVTETALAELPGADEIAITWEKYDSFPLQEETRNNTHWSEGIGLMLSEKERLTSLKEAYSSGRRPLQPAPALPAETGFAILPLDPESFGGIGEYYFLPEKTLTDEQLLQLIAYGEEKGIPFSPETLTAKNSMRGVNSEVNRLFSAGEQERHNNLWQRIFQEGLDAPQQDMPVLTLPVSGIAYIPMNPDLTAGLDTFAFFPFRELTDEELLLDMRRYGIFDEGYTYLNPAEETDLHPAQDNEKIRRLLEDLMQMPISAKWTGTTYRRKESTGEIRITANFESARINGKKTYYVAKIDLASRRPVFMEQFVLDDAISTPPSAAQAPTLTGDVNDPRWADIVREAVQKLTDQNIKQIKPTSRMFLEAYMYWAARFSAILEDGSSYQLVLVLPEGTVSEVYYSPNWQDAEAWYLENQW